MSTEGEQVSGERLREIFATEGPYIIIDEDGNALVPDDQADAIKAAFDAAPSLAPFGKPLRKALKFYLALSSASKPGER